MVFVVYIAPNYTENAVKFIEKLTDLPDIRFGLISQEPLSLLRPDILQKITDFEQILDVFSYTQLLSAANKLVARQGQIYRLFGAVEQVQVPAARVREDLGIEGMSAETMLNFRDKARMKELFRSAGIPCARHCLGEDAKEIVDFAEKTGFPLVIKPNDGAASQATYMVENMDDLRVILSKTKISHDKPLLAEEFISGTEHSFDTFSLAGNPVFHSVTDYYPNPLTVVRNPWIQWQVVLPREVESAPYDDIRQAAFRALEVLGMQTAMSHMEWFRRGDGSIAISEVAARPPGAQFTTLISRANEMDAITAWARLMIFGEFTVPERKYAVGAAYLRGQGNGRVTGVSGLEKINREIGHLITDAKIPKPGQEKGMTYEGEGYIILRHPDTSVVRDALQMIVSTAHVHLG